MACQPNEQTITEVLTKTGRKGFFSQSIIVWGYLKVVQLKAFS